MWRDLAEDQTFWATVAGASTALLIAVVLEVRTGREELDRHALQASAERRAAVRENELDWQKWKIELDKYLAGKGADPGDPPVLSAPLPEEDPVELKLVEETGDRVRILLLTLWTLAAVLVGSLVIASPADYFSSIFTHIGLVATLGCALAAICGLVWATTTRITKG